MRTCDNCTKCCEGWLSGTVHGHAMCSGTPCYFLKSKCTIYNTRPEDPCRQFNCAWIEEDFPDWMKPDRSEVIVAKKIPPHDTSLTYYMATETGKKIDSVVLNWLVQWAVSNGKNLIYQVDGNYHMLGSANFITEAKKVLNV